MLLTGENGLASSHALLLVTTSVVKFPSTASVTLLNITTIGWLTTTLKPATDGKADKSSERSQDTEESNLK